MTTFQVQPETETQQTRDTLATLLSSPLSSTPFLPSSFPLHPPAPFLPSFLPLLSSPPFPLLSFSLLPFSAFLSSSLLSAVPPVPPGRCPPVPLSPPIRLIRSPPPGIANASSS